MYSDISKNRPNVLLLQRAIPHYRMPLFRKLCEEPSFNLTICAAAYDSKTSTGLPAENFEGLNFKLIKVHKIGQILLFQQIISIRHYDVIILDLSINIMSNPFYLFLAKYSSVKVIGWGKGIPQNLTKTESFIHRFYKKISAKQCDCLILYGEISRKYFESLGIKKPMFVAQNTIDTQRLIDNRNNLSEQSKELRKELGLENVFVFGYFGTLTERKQVDQIIEAFKIIKHSYQKSVLVIAGSGPSETKLKQSIENWEYRSSVIFLGKIQTGNEGKIISMFDAFLSFSQGGLGILEAMATSRLIISTPEVFPETELLINNVNCLLSEDFTFDGFARSMTYALKMGDKRLEIGYNALKTVSDKATIRNMVEAFKDAIFCAVNIY